MDKININNIIFKNENFYIYFKDIKWDKLIIRSYYIVKDNMHEVIGSHFTDNANDNYETPIFNEKMFAIISKNINDNNYYEIKSLFDIERMSFISDNQDNLKKYYEFLLNSENNDINIKK